MVDVSTLVLIGGAFGSAGVATKFLGPTVEYLGGLAKDEVQGFVETRQAANVGRVVQNAVDKADLSNEGAVAPRVLGAVVDEAVFAEDELLVEYLGGVLASGRTPQGRDDRGVAWVATIKSLSSYAVRLHFLMYSSAVRVLQQRPSFNMYDGTQRSIEGGVFIPFSELLPGMDLAEDEVFHEIFNHAVQSLLEAELIDHRHYSFGGSVAAAAGAMQTVTDNVPKPGIAFVVSPRGAELFVWAAGSSEVDGSTFLAGPAMKDFSADGVAVPTGYSFEEVRGGLWRST